MGSNKGNHTCLAGSLWSQEQLMEVKNILESGRIMHFLHEKVKENAYRGNTHTHTHTHTYIYIKLTSK